MAVDIQKQTEDLAKKLGTDATKVDAITKQVEPEELLGQEGKTLTGQGTLVQPAVPDLQTWWYGRRDRISPDICKDENVV